MKNMAGWFFAAGLVVMVGQTVLASEAGDLFDQCMTQEKDSAYCARTAGYDPETAMDASSCVKYGNQWNAATGKCVVGAASTAATNGATNSSSVYEYDKCVAAGGSSANCAKTAQWDPATSTDARTCPVYGGTWDVSQGKCNKNSGPAGLNTESANKRTENPYNQTGVLETLLGVIGIGKNSSSSASPGMASGITGRQGCTDGFQMVNGLCVPPSSLTGLPDPAGGVPQIILNLLSWLLGAFSVLAVMAFVISGIQYITDFGEAERAKKAKLNATYAIYGILVGLSGFIIVKAIKALLSAQTF